MTGAIARHIKSATEKRLVHIRHYAKLISAGNCLVFACSMCDDLGINNKGLAKDRSSTEPHVLSHWAIPFVTFYNVKA